MSLGAAMRDARLTIEPAQESHREALRAACAKDSEIWEIYPASFIGEHFDSAFDAFFHDPWDYPFVLFENDELVGMTSYLRADEANGSLEIGRTYLVPRARGTGLNARVKRLMIDRAFAEGFTRVEFRIDTRNTRSMAAVGKLGAVHEGTLRRNRVTWTGHLRDTAVFAILAEEWRALRAAPGRMAGARR